MKVQQATKRETLHIAMGVLCFSAVMNLVFALLGRWEPPVLWGSLLGGGFAILNFFASCPTPSECFLPYSWWCWPLSCPG